jgi:hypothetical protein
MLVPEVLVAVVGHVFPHVRLDAVPWSVMVVGCVLTAWFLLRGCKKNDD